MVYQSKPKPCKNCGLLGHTPINCWQRKRRPISSSKGVERSSRPIRQVGKIQQKWLKFRIAWFDTNPPDEYGFYHCYYCTYFNLGSSLTRKETTLDHYRSRSAHPELRFNEDNIVPCCWWHNSDKGSIDGDKYIEILQIRLLNGEKVRGF
jgi:5-methylcytosine-specific restriction endonuclease McrA